MRTIDKSKPILVTGATSYVGGWIIKKLLEDGCDVHGAVRNPDAKEKLEHLTSLQTEKTGKLTFFKSDLLEEGSYKEGMKDCELVFHVASPFTSKFTDPQKELVDPAVKGTKNVLTTANETDSVKRVVVTSSCVAIYTDNIDAEKVPNGVFTEEIWNTTASLEHQPYAYSKVLAEKEAWEIAGLQTKWDLVVVNPSLVAGFILESKINDFRKF